MSVSKYSTITKKKSFWGFIAVAFSRGVLGAFERMPPDSIWRTGAKLLNLPHLVILNWRHYYTESSTLHFCALLPHGSLSMLRRVLHTLLCAY